MSIDNSLNRGLFHIFGCLVFPVAALFLPRVVLLSRWQQITEHQRRRYYKITDMGRRFLADRLAEWKDFSTAISMLMGTNLNR